MTAPLTRSGKVFERRLTPITKRPTEPAIFGEVCDVGDEALETLDSELPFEVHGRAGTLGISLCSVIDKTR